MSRIFRKTPNLVQLAIIASCASVMNGVFAVELFEEDSLGNVNQRNVGSYKSNSHGSPESAGPVVKRSRPLQPYATLKLEIPVELVYYESGNPRVEIEAPDSVINKINFVHGGNRLTIKSNGFSINAPVRLKLYGNDLQRVFINSAAEVELNDIGVNDFYLSVRGAADVTVQGSATGCQVNAQGANDIDLSQLICRSATLAVQGSSDIVLSASESIKGRAQGAGDIEVLGNPAKRQLQAMGAYDIDYR